MKDERDTIRKLSKAGMNPKAIAAAVFCTKRQVRYTLAHPDDQKGAAAMIAVRGGETLCEIRSFWRLR